MNSPLELIQDCRRAWWWSSAPFWKYLDENGQGWANLVDNHPGMFNLVWLLSGRQSPPEVWSPYMQVTQWVVLEAPHVRVQGQPLLDLAFRLKLPEFNANAASLLPKFTSVKAKRA